MLENTIEVFIVFFPLIVTIIILIVAGKLAEKFIKKKFPRSELVSNAGGTGFVSVVIFFGWLAFVFNSILFPNSPIALEVLTTSHGVFWGTVIVVGTFVVFGTLLEEITNRRSEKNDT